MTWSWHLLDKIFHAHVHAHVQIRGPVARSATRRKLVLALPARAAASHAATRAVGRARPRRLAAKRAQPARHQRSCASSELRTPPQRSGETASATSHVESKTTRKSFVYPAKEARTPPRSARRWWCPGHPTPAASARSPASTASGRLRHVNPACVHSVEAAHAASRAAVGCATSASVPSPRRASARRHRSAPSTCITRCSPTAYSPAATVLTPMSASPVGETPAPSVSCATDASETAHRPRAAAGGARVDAPTPPPLAARMTAACAGFEHLDVPDLEVLAHGVRRVERCREDE